MLKKQTHTYKNNLSACYHALENFETVFINSHTHSSNFSAMAVSFKTFREQNHAKRSNCL